MSAAAPHPDIVIIHASAAGFEARDRNDRRFFIEASLRAGDVLSFKVLAVATDGTRSAIRGAEFFDVMLDHFEAVAVVNVVEGDWTDSMPAYLTNLEAFNAETAAGTAPELAASRTPSGKYATRRGYDKVNVTRLDGSPGRYRHVVAEFSR